MLRSLLTVVVGYAVIAADRLLKSLVLPRMAPGDLPGTPWMALLLLTDLFAAAVAGYVTARVAAHARVRHALALGIVLVILGVAALIAGDAPEPVWYQLGRIVLALPSVAAGGHLARAHVARRAGLGRAEA